MNRVMHGEVRHEQKEGLVLILVNVLGSQFRQAIRDVLASIESGYILGVVKPSTTEVGVDGMWNVKVKAVFGWAGILAKVPFAKQCG